MMKCLARQTVFFIANRACWKRDELSYTKHLVWLNVIKKVANVSFAVYVTINLYTFNSFTFDIKYYQLSVLYIQEITMNSHKVEINKSFALWKKSRHIKLFLLIFQHPPPTHTHNPHPFATALLSTYNMHVSSIWLFNEFHPLYIPDTEARRRS